MEKKRQGLSLTWLDLEPLPCHLILSLSPHHLLCTSVWHPPERPLLSTGDDARLWRFLSVCLQLLSIEYI